MLLCLRDWRGTSLRLGDRGVGWMFVCKINVEVAIAMFG
jgi:hypothetical protein